MTLIRRGLLSEVFKGAAVKRLSAVETNKKVSNQHELNGVSGIRRLLGDEDRRDIPTRFVWLGGEQEAISAEGVMSWYDARRRTPNRTEYRFYYSSNTVTDLMAEGDSLFFALRNDGSAMVVIAPEASTIRSQLLWLFGLDDETERGFTAVDLSAGANRLDFAARYILDELGLDIEEPETDRLDALLEPFGLDFPSTRLFSDLARRTAPGDPDANEDPDVVLMAWTEWEEKLFRRLERRIVAERLRSGFGGDADDVDVEGFYAFSLSVQNRRKSRAGQSLEHHLEVLFKARGIHHERGAVTERRFKPDFLFPGKAAYRDPDFPAARLTMLAAKSTLKDRWRQVLTEARRIETKHLITLQPSISLNQTDQMLEEGVQLVVPAPIQPTYLAAQRARLMSVADFMNLVTHRQRD
jgi:hypothetical protein